MPINHNHTVLIKIPVLEKINNEDKSIKEWKTWGRRATEKQAVEIRPRSSLPIPQRGSVYLTVPLLWNRIVKLRTRQARQRTEIAALPPRSFPSGVSLGPSLGLPPLPCPCCYSLPPPFFKCLLCYISRDNTLERQCFIQLIATTQKMSPTVIKPL